MKKKKTWKKKFRQKYISINSKLEDAILQKFELVYMSVNESEKNSQAMSRAQNT